MKKLKKITPIFVLFLLAVPFTGCRSYLDLNPEVKALLEATCPSTISTYGGHDEGPTDEGGAMVKTKSSSINEDNTLFLSYSTGVAVTFPIAEQFSFESGLYLSGKGNKTATGSGSNALKAKLSLTYIDLPLLANYQFGESGFNVFGGLQPSVLISAKNKIDFEGNSDSQNVKDQYKTLDIATSIGVGYNFENGIGLRFGYSHGLSNIEKEESGLKTKNRTLKLGVSYVFTK